MDKGARETHGEFTGVVLDGLWRTAPVCEGGEK